MIIWIFEVRGNNTVSKYTARFKKLYCYHVDWNHWKKYLKIWYKMLMRKQFNVMRRTRKYECWEQRCFCAEPCPAVEPWVCAWLWEERRMWFTNNTSPEDGTFPGCKRHSGAVHAHGETHMDAPLLSNSTAVGVWNLIKAEETEASVQQTDCPTFNNKVIV